MHSQDPDNTDLYIGTLEDMCIVDGRIYFKNSLDNLKLYSMDLTGKDIRYEGDLTEPYYLTFWNGKMYWSNDDGGCLYRANYDGSEMAKPTGDAVDSITVSDGWIMYNNLGDYHLHMMDAETLADHSVMLEGIYDPTISPWDIIGRKWPEPVPLRARQLRRQRAVGSCGGQHLRGGGLHLLPRRGNRAGIHDGYPRREHRPALADHGGAEAMPRRPHFIVSRTGGPSRAVSSLHSCV